ncbi:MAG: DUF72 domain-containing protein, partial [Saprospiraceae bacterium]|nr:DUF72 domain-containing protein [Saprospiraceae bacterium]
MKFGKLQDISQVDFSLPSTPEATQFVLQQQDSDTPKQFFIGCTGWSMKEWVGKVYPKNTKTKDFLQAYGKQFNTIELNTTHYRIPNTSTIEKWYQETPADFQFCPKIPQVISHSRDLGFTGGQLPAFCEAISGLKEKLGCCFIQLPPYFNTDRIKIIENFLTRWPKTMLIAFEIRHESWFQDPKALLDLHSLLVENNAAFVITDVAGRRDVLHQMVSNALTMVRFVGNGLHSTDYSRIDAWIDLLKEWLEAGLQKVYFFPHEPDNILAPELSEYVL